MYILKRDLKRCPKSVYIFSFDYLENFRNPKKLTECFFDELVKLKNYPISGLGKVGF